MESSRSSFLEPKSIFFRTGELRDRKDWESCFHLKAAAVYSSITKRQADAMAMPIASKLLISIAENCASTQPPTQPLQGATEYPTAPAVKEIQTQTKKSDDTLATLSTSMMEAIDAVYLVVGILHDLKDKSEKSSDREKLDVLYSTTHGEDAISDVVKIGNQLPLDFLITTVENFQTALQKAVGSLKLSVTTNEGLISSINGFKLNFDKNNFHGTVHLFCWYYSPFQTKFPATSVTKEVFSSKKNLLECLYSSLVDTSSRTAGTGGVVGTLVAQPLPTASRLVQSRLGFGAKEDGMIRVQFSNTTLRIPAMVFDHKLETVVMNLLAWERLCGGERPVARYLMLLRALVDGEEDIRILGKAGVLLGRWWKVMELLSRVEGLASCLMSYPAIDDEVEKVMKAHGQWARRLTVRNRPVVVWASAAALVSLLVTAIVVKRRRGRQAN